MIKIFLKNYFLFAFLIFIFIVITFYLSKVMEKAILNKSALSFSNGVFNYVSEQLHGLDSYQIDLKLNEIQKNVADQKVKIIAYSSLPNALKSNDNLAKGKVVEYHSFLSGVHHGSLYSLYSAYDIRYAFKRLGQSKNYMRIVLGSPQILEVKRNTQWITNIVRESFKDKNVDQFERISKHLSDIFGIEVSLKKQDTLTSKESEFVNQWGLLALSYFDGHVYDLAIPISGTDVLVVLHGISDHLAGFEKNFYFYLLLIIGLVIMLICWIWSYVFYKTLNKVQVQAIEYGKGNFDYHIKVPSLLSLSPLNQALKNMATRIDLLLTSHKDLTNAIAHELKTPLARVRFSLGLLKVKNPQLDQSQLADIDDEIEILDKLINEILLHAKFDRKGVVLNFEKESVTEVVSARLEHYRKRFPDKNWTMNISEKVEASFDRSLISRMMDNLLINAYYYGGNNIQVSVFCVYNQISITVEDDGVGVEPCDYEKIFSPFERLNPSRENEIPGHGLGLSICDKIAQAHKGTVRADKSTLGGAKFEIEFPRSLTPK
ncbi:ATP-binding protein [Vibrio sp. S4M6]|uniref:ATP-binding protein n=1 Tax=Vibrio sinus TaxID=2946865 RepID=UPI00202AC15B|nr:ATP-binding protein [Vibrio sinus]MCL9781766.1 ATP-binding protein [Vibrio sinus]